MNPMESLEAAPSPKHTILCGCGDEAILDMQASCSTSLAARRFIRGTFGEYRKLIQHQHMTSNIQAASVASSVTGTVVV